MRFDKPAEQQPLAPALVIRAATTADSEALAAIILPIIRAGETYALPRDMTASQALDYWMAPDRSTFVADAAGVVLGTYYLRANQLGGGDHVANCGYMTHTAARGRGIARAMCQHSLNVARERGFRAMQFNFVVASNVGAIALWQSLGFRALSRLPDAFRHPTFGYVDALIMSRTLGDALDARSDAAARA